VSQRSFILDGEKEHFSFSSSHFSILIVFASKNRKGWGQSPQAIGAKCNCASLCHIAEKVSFCFTSICTEIKVQISFCFTIVLLTVIFVKILAKKAFKMFHIEVEAVYLLVKWMK